MTDRRLADDVVFDNLGQHYPCEFTENFSGGYPPGKPGNGVGDVPAGIPVSNDRILESS
jgi:hypothetical protein